MADAAEPARPEILDGDARAVYANFGRVASTPEELILDFGLNPNPPGAKEPAPVKVTERVILNHYTAKRIALALSMALERHEKAFGTLELDANKRVVPQSGGAGDTPK
ncbi:MAG: DUF3467 domain-containing protein [Planctomycetota bacterium]